MKFQILGCGTSTGVPIPGCRCSVCLSPHPRNKRSRTSGIVKLPNAAGSRILIDASTDLRMQALTHDIRRIDAVMFTHAHADHILGVEDLRGFNFIQQERIPCFGSAETNAELRRFYKYIFSPANDYEGGGLAQLTLHEISSGIPFSTCGVPVTPFLLWHGKMPVIGYRIRDFAYATDCSRIPEESMAILQGVTTLVLDGLRFEPHATHFTIPDACSVAQKLGVKKTYLTHTTHTIEYEAVSAQLPAGIELAYDGLEFDI